MTAGNDADITTATAGNDATVTAGNDATITDLTATAGDAVVEATAGDADIETLTAGTDAAVTAGNDATITTVTAGNDTTVTAGHDADITTMTAGNDTTVTAGHDADITTATAGNDAAVTAGNDATITDLTATAGDAVVEATAGDADIETLTAGTDAAVTAGNDADITTVTAGNDTTVTAGNDATITTVTAGSDATVTAGNDADITTATAGNDAAVTAGNDADIDTLTTGNDAAVTAGEGDAHVHRLDAGGDLLVQTPGGNADIDRLAVDGIASILSDGDITVDQTTGDLTVGRIDAGGNVDLTLDSGVTDADEEDRIRALAEAKAAAAQAQAKLEALLQQLAAERAYLTPLEQELAELRAERDELNAQKAALEAQTPATAAEERRNERELEKLNDRLAGVEEEIAEIEGKLRAEYPVEDAVRRQIEQAQAAADAARQALADAQEAADGVHASIAAGGEMDITMAHGGSVGSEDNSLSIDAGGRITIAADEGYALDGVYLESPSGDPLHTAPITAGTIRIDAAGDIDPVEAAPEPPRPGEEPEEEDDEDVIIPSFTATDLTLNSTGGDTGTREDPIYVYTDGLSAMGEQVNIINLKDTRLDQVIADGEANITSTGDITAGEPDTPGGNHVIAGDAELIAEEGDVGTKEEPIKVQAGTVAAEGDNVYLTSDGDIIADGIKARDEVHLVTGGSVKDDPDGHGHAISSKDLYIWAGGSIGEEGNPLNVRVTGRIEAYSRLDMIYLFNYRPPIVHLPYLFPDADGNIRPGDPLTRGEAAQAIYILLSLMAAELPEGLLDVALPENPFADLDADSPYYEMVLTLYALGAFDGWQLDGVFDADAQITRAELLSLLVWMLRLTGRELPEAEATEPAAADIDASHWAYAEVLIALRLEWIGTDADGCVHPDEAISRGEAAAVINRAAGRCADAAAIGEMLELGLAAGFPDLPADHPYFADVMEAAVPHTGWANYNGTEEWDVEGMLEQAAQEAPAA